MIAHHTVTRKKGNCAAGIYIYRQLGEANTSSLKGDSALLPVSAFRLGFINGLMSESMILKFGAMLIWKEKRSNTITVKGI